MDTSICFSPAPEPKDYEVPYSQGQREKGRRQKWSWESVFSGPSHLGSPAPGWPPFHPLLAHWPSSTSPLTNPALKSSGTFACYLRHIKEHRGTEKEEVRGGEGLLPTLYLKHWLAMAVPGGKTGDSLQTGDTGCIDLYKSVSVCSAQSALGGALAAGEVPGNRTSLRALWWCEGG